MMRSVSTLLALMIANGCATTNAALEQRVADLERELSRRDARPETRSADVVRPNIIVPTIPTGHLMSVDARPSECDDDALCWTIENGHDFPVLVESIDGQPVVVMNRDPMIPPHARAYVILADPGEHTLRYMKLNKRSIPGFGYVALATVLKSCTVRWRVDVNQFTHIGHFFCG